MLKIAFANRKGGVSKTSLCAALAIEAAKSGLRVALADADTQGSLTAWAEARAAGGRHDLALLGADALADLPAAVKGLEADYDVMFFDTAAGLGESVERVIFLADLTIIPVRPSPNDLRAVGGTMSLLGGQPYGFVITQAIGNSSLVNQAFGALSEHGAICGQVMGMRVGYASAMIDGRTAQEIEGRGGKAAREIAAIWSWVQGRAGTGMAR